VEPVTVDRYGRTEPLFYFVMSYPNLDLASSNVHISSAVAEWMVSAYHKILESVKGSRVIPLCGGWPGDHKIVGKMEVKVPAE